MQYCNGIISIALSHNSDWRTNDTSIKLVCVRKRLYLSLHRQNYISDTVTYDITEKHDIINDFAWLVHCPRRYYYIIILVCIYNILSYYVAIYEFANNNFAIGVKTL